MGFFRILFIVLLVFLVFRILGSLFRPRQMQGGNFFSDRHGNVSRKEGEVSIQVDPKKNTKKVDKDQGDYIPFEEA
ncbi:MAG: hypothetical protein IPM71_09215 [Bacteroidota bacterium]|nr:MAG: hypothetical protein IPM71_09215 [Bacteroidota bacterium]